MLSSFEDKCGFQLINQNPSEKLSLLLLRAIVLVALFSMCLLHTIMTGHDAIPATPTKQEPLLLYLQT